MAGGAPSRVSASLRAAAWLRMRRTEREESRVTTYANILVETAAASAHSPQSAQALNALNSALIEDLNSARRLRATPTLARSC